MLTQAAQTQMNSLDNIRRYFIMNDDKQKTLCAYVEEELQVKDPQTYIAFIKPATHYCEGCGRSAVSAENLCKPQKL